MKNPFSAGDKKYYEKVVGEDETARFESGEVHPFYGTFSLGRDAEWSSRLFVLDMKEDEEEGIGTYLNIRHLAPALVGDKVSFTAIFDRVEGTSVHCTFAAYVGKRKIAEGETGQRILKKDQIKKITKNISGEG